MTERELECFDGIGRGRWGKEHSKVLNWADSHPLSPWKDPNVDGMPIEDGEYLVVINSPENNMTWVELCYYEKNRKSFTTWVDDDMYIYRKKDVKYWMKIPDYK